MASARSLRARRNKRRAARPTDWLGYLQPIALELPIALEILSRLRWARALQQRGVAIAPLPAGRYRPKFATSEPLPPDSIVQDGDARTKVLSVLKSPEEIAATVSTRDLQQQLDVWEREIAMWGVVIWKKLGEQFRLRDQRANVLEFIHSDFWAGMSEAKVAALYDRMTAAPNETHHTSFGSVSHFYVPVDEFGNETGEQPSSDELEELASRPRDERELRRLYRGEHKKSRGGVRDVNPVLLHSRKGASSVGAIRTNDAGSLSSASASISGSVSAASTGPLVLRRANHGKQVSNSERRTSKERKP